MFKFEDQELHNEVILCLESTLHPAVTGVEVSDSEESDLEDAPIYQRHWFSALLESGLSCERESRLGQIRAELRRRVNQTWRGMPLPPLGPHGRNQHSNLLVEALLQSARRHPSQAALFLRSSQHGKSCHSHMKHNRLAWLLLAKSCQNCVTLKSDHITERYIF